MIGRQTNNETDTQRRRHSQTKTETLNREKVKET